jgi:hypothetical protein
MIRVTGIYKINKTSPSLLILSISLIKLWFDISNLFSTKKKPLAKATGLLLWAVTLRGSISLPAGG